MVLQLEQLVHGASKQATVRSTTPTPSSSTPTKISENRISQGGEQSSSNNTDAINQLSTAPPGTGPPPTLNDTPDVNNQASETNQSNGNLNDINTDLILKTFYVFIFNCINQDFFKFTSKY